ncbi:MAG: cytochrome c biogenesis protein CcsA [Leptospiraceae bacterium]|nr:cytochrome c biogenesis protein CcsA [Leptospiraceae bacterium]MDW7976763.1 cytochrome c biogenesis protein CcsA [Leptospiraceae bacterium]
MLSWNELGSITIVVIGILVLFSFLMGLLSLPTKLKFQLLRSLILELLFRKNKLKVIRFYRRIVEVWEYLSLKTFEFLKINKNQALELAKQGLIVNFFVTLIAATILWIQLIISDYSSKYVVSYSSDGLSLFYRLTAIWAGPSGSLLFWYLILSFFSFYVLYKDRFQLQNRIPIVILILSSIHLLFISLILYFEDGQPFLEYYAPMKAGKGMNPLLLHWAMIIHPPILYIGYVSYAIPFALYISSVISGNVRQDLLSLFRRWGLFSWFFLGFGILLGSLWAYEELGWGGYWAWDPVENASLMPFLFGTAFLHSLAVLEQRKMFHFWSLLLIVLTYHFCLLGTWITRSGVIEGPHSFAKSDIGIPLIIYIIISFLYFVRFLYFKRHLLVSKEHIQNITSKEGSFLLNNYLMVISVVIILIGVFSPLIPYHCSFNDGFQCFKVEWKPTTFNKVMVPIGILMLLIMGLSPLQSWRKPISHIYEKSIKKPLWIGLIGTLLYAFVYFFYLRPFVKLENSPWGPQIVADIFSILTVGIGIFVIAGIVQEYQRAIRVRRIRMKESLFQSFIQILRRNQRRYGGYLVHLSIVILFIGFSGGSFKTEYQVQFHYTLMPPQSENSPYIYYYSGDKVYIQGYTIEARELFIRPFFEPNADPNNPIYLTISQESHYRVNPTQHLPVITASQVDPYQFANEPTPFLEKIENLAFGIISDQRMITERRFYPQIHPYTGDLIRTPIGFGERLVTSEPEIISSWTEDIYIQVGAIFDPHRNKTPDIASMFEFYYYDLKRSPEAYYMLFPKNIVVDVQIWINPFMKLLWLGTFLFFIAGLIVFLPQVEIKK